MITGKEMGDRKRTKEMVVWIAGLCCLMGKKMLQRGGLPSLYTWSVLCTLSTGMVYSECAVPNRSVRLRPRLAQEGVVEDEGRSV